LKLHLLDTDYFKSLATARLRPDAIQPLVLHSGADETLSKQLCSEELVLQGSKRVWRRKHKENHFFDCLCMNLACVHQSFTPNLAHFIGEGRFDIETHIAVNTNNVQRTKKHHQKKKRGLW